MLASQICSLKLERFLAWSDWKDVWISWTAGSSCQAGVYPMRGQQLSIRFPVPLRPKKFKMGVGQILCASTRPTAEPFDSSYGRAKAHIKETAEETPEKGAGGVPSKVAKRKAEEHLISGQHLFRLPGLLSVISWLFFRHFAELAHLRAWEKVDGRQGRKGPQQERWSENPCFAILPVCGLQGERMGRGT